MMEISYLKNENLGDMPLDSGVTLRDVNVSYTCFGRLAEDGSNAVLVLHGFTSGPLMLVAKSNVAEGSWAELVGPGKPLDTDRFFIVCPNHLGSCYGTTGPSSINPATNHTYGPDFPEITFSDIVRSQLMLLKKLGVNRLRAAVGTSYGGMLAQQWALEHPAIVDAIGVVVSGPRLPSGSTRESILSVLASDPEWRDGKYLSQHSMKETLRKFRTRTLLNYGYDVFLHKKYGSPEAAGKAFDSAVEEWASQFDANSLLVLRKAAESFNSTGQYGRISADVLYVVSSSDRLFPPSSSQTEMLDQLPRGEIQYSYMVFDSDYGHMASGLDHAKWSFALANLLAQRPLEINIH